VDDDQHEGGNSDELQSAQEAATSTLADADDAVDDIELSRQEYVDDGERKIHVDLYEEYVEDDALKIHVVAIDAPISGPIAPSLYGPIVPPWPSCQRALHPLTDDDLRENIVTLRDQVMRLFGEREARHFAPALAVLPEITDRRVQERQFRRIDRDRRAWRDADRHSLMTRELDLEMLDAGACPGIEQHVARVGGACDIWGLKPSAAASEITKDADREWSKDAPMPLSAALRLDPPEAPPTKKELDALRERARKLRTEHDQRKPAVSVR
jgi:hypothetical protein